MDKNITELKNSITEDVQEICVKYGIHGNVVNYDPFSHLPGIKNPKLYIVASLDSANVSGYLPEDIKPDEIVRRNKRASNVIYTDCWAWDMTEGNRQQALIELIDYANCMETLKGIYAEFSTPMPEKIRTNEVNDLIDFYRAYSENKDKNNSTYRFAKKSLEKYFKNENSKSKLRQRWKNFYRSEKFPFNKSKFTQLKCFLSSHKNIIDKDILVDNCSEFHTLEMSEHEYKEFAKIIKNSHPEITYAISDITDINHGGLGKVDKSTNPPTRYVSDEEFAAVIKNRFATEGGECIKDLKPCYWEYRKIHYNSADEPVIAGIYNYVAYQYSNAIDIKNLNHDGNISIHKIYTEDFMNFVCEAYSQGLDYSIDFKGRYGKPSLDFINIITRTSDNDIVNRIIDINLDFKSDNDHKIAMANPTLPSLDNMLHDIDDSKEENYFSAKEHSNERQDDYLF